MEENEMEEWVIVEYNNFGDIDDDVKRRRSKLGWILETGLSLGKNAVMTGVIISSIPILVPPLVVFAALGCAFSLPLGFIFATHACTNKLMSKLLPIPLPPPPPPPYNYPEGDQEKQMFKGDVETRVDDFQVGSVGPDTATINAEKTDHLYAAAEDIKFAEEGGDNKNAEKTTTVAAEGPAPNTGKSSGERRGRKRKTRKKKELEGGDDDVKPIALDDHENADQEKLSLGPVVDDIGESRQSDVVDIISKTRSAGESYDQEKTVANDNDVDVDGGARSDDVEHEVRVETNDESTVDVDVDVVISEIAVDVFTNDEEGVVDKKIELHSVTIYSEPAGGNDNQAKAKTVADDDEVKEEIKDTDRVVGDDAHSDEGLFGEDDEEIRKKMEGIRAIVGYKGPKVDSYTEELKALYVFIGIEPPPDSADFQNKLRFLMSVIGLK